MARHRGETWRRRHLLAAGYDSAVHCGPVARIGARLLWGYDVRQAWAAIDEIAQVTPGSRVLDMPSGGGIALRGLPSRPRIRYVAADISPVMLSRVRTRVRERAGSQSRTRRGPPTGRASVGAVHTGGQAPAAGPAPGAGSAHGVGPVQADIAALPFPDGTFDLCLSYNGLHCFTEPAAAIGEYARVLRPGGVLRGTTIVARTGRWHDAVTWALRRVHAFGPPFGTAELAGWFWAAGLEGVLVSRHGAVASFVAHRSTAPGREAAPHRRV